MKKSIYSIEYQNKDVASRLVFGLERVSEAIKVMIWQEAKTHGLSPIQIQILIFLEHHPEEMGKASVLAEEFNVTRPTISDAVKVLVLKGLVKRAASPDDGRVFFLELSPSGKKMVRQTEHFLQPVREIVEGWSKGQQEEMMESVFELIGSLNKRQILSVQRTCSTCRFHACRGATGHYCTLLDAPLATRDLRLDCPDYKERA